MNVDSLQSVIAELRSSGYDRDGMHDKWADRLECIDAEMRAEIAQSVELERLMQQDIEELRERLAAAEKKAPPSK